MSWMAFVVLMTKSLAWPLTVLAILYLLREPIRGLLPLLRELKYKDLHLTFGERVQELAVEAADALPATPAAPSPQTDEVRRLERLGEISPRSAILEAWIPVERAAANLVVRKGVQLADRDRQLPYAVIDTLVKQGVVSQEEAGLFRTLRYLRNLAAHETDFSASAESVRVYADVAARLASIFNSR